MKPEITLVLGGARSGKSALAERIALASNMPVTYLATADVKDAEMAERVAVHKSRRPKEWRTWEGAPDTLPNDISEMSGLLLMDCLTMWLTRLFLATGDSETEDEKKWEARELEIRALTEKLCVAAKDDTHLVIVSNEVGFGLVPPYLMGRRFRDMQGRMNQLCAQHASRVALVVAGCPLWVKGTHEGLNI